MELTDIRIRNFRSIGTEQRVPLSNSMTLVGPNNTGKTNILLGIKMLFTGFDNRYAYDREVDLTFGTRSARTSIIGSFRGDPENDDQEIYEKLDRLHSLQGTKRESTDINLTLYFTETGTPVYSFFPNIKRPQDSAKNAQYSSIHKPLTSALLEKFKIHYVPSARSIKQLYEELLTPFLRRLAAQVIDHHVSQVQSELDNVALSLNHELENVGLNSIKASFSLPNNSVEPLITGFDFMLSDPNRTTIFQKGMGIQSTALLASFLWITREEKRTGTSVIWLLEEPESYLHPELSAKCFEILKHLEQESLVVKTTHSISFIPQDPTVVRGTWLENNKTQINQFKTYAEATTKLRKALGIRFSDFYNLDNLNVLVEGPSDRDLLKWFLNKENTSNWNNLRKAQILDFGGVSHLAGFLRATYEFIQKERACVALFDGDEAGEKERRRLQSFFGQKQIQFVAHKDFISTRDRFAIEGLFPDAWLVELNGLHQNWFESFSTDASGQLQPFKIKDNHKNDAMKYLKDRAESQTDQNWNNRFMGLCDVLDSALKKQCEKLET